MQHRIFTAVAMEPRQNLIILAGALNESEYHPHNPQSHRLIGMIPALVLDVNLIFSHYSVQHPSKGHRKVGEPCRLCDNCSDVSVVSRKSRALLVVSSLDAVGTLRWLAIRTRWVLLKGRGALIWNPFSHIASSAAIRAMANYQTKIRDKRQSAARACCSSPTVHTQRSVGPDNLEPIWRARR